MPATGPTPVPVPLSSFPGDNPQESAGRLINCYAEALGDPQQQNAGAPRNGIVWRRMPGLTQFAVTGGQIGYRGGLLSAGLSYEVFAGEALTVDETGTVVQLGAFPGISPISIAQNQNASSPDVVAVDPIAGAFVLHSQITPATSTITVSGSPPGAGAIYILTFTNPIETLNGLAWPVTVTINPASGTSIDTIAAQLVSAINGNAVLSASNVSADNTGNFSVTATINGTTFTNGDIVSLSFTNPAIGGFPLIAIYRVPAVSSAISIASGLVAIINSNPLLAATHITASNASGTSATIAIAQVGASGNQTIVGFSKTGSGDETCTFNPASGIMAAAGGTMITINHIGLIGNSTTLDGNTNMTLTIFTGPTSPMTGGAGIAGVFTGVPTFYNGQTNLPAVNSVAFQDGYFFFTTAAGSVYASGINALTQNALTFGRIIAKAGVTLLRGIAYQGYMFFFTSASIEVWQDAAIAAPGFPYQRSAILPYGLVQGSAIAGAESGFDDLLWVAGDYGVYRMTYGSFTPSKVSPPDLDRLIQKQVLAGNTLTASVYMFSGKKVWVLSSPNWTWTFHLDTQKWFERASLLPNGAYGAWRGIGGHQAFNKWLMGDTQGSGALVFLDETNYADITYQDPTTWQTIQRNMLFRIETGLVDDFPVRIRVARADFHFVRGVGTPVGQSVLTITGAAAGTGGVVRLAVLTSLGVNDGDQVQVTDIFGTVEANGVHAATVIDGMHIELQDTVFANPYVSGGTLTDVTVQPSLTNPTIAISWSDDGGVSYRPPMLRNLGPLEVIKTGRIVLKNIGMTEQIGRRYRMDVTAPVYTAFLRATQSDVVTIPN